MIESAMTDLARWDARYSAPGYLFGTEPNSFLKEQAPRLKAGEIALAIADGEGRNGVWLAEQGLKVVSIDFSPIALEKARRLAAARGVTARVVRIASLARDIDEPDDLRDLISHPAETATHRLLAEMQIARRLEPVGAQHAPGS